MRILQAHVEERPDVWALVVSGAGPATQLHLSTDGHAALSDVDCVGLNVQLPPGLVNSGSSGRARRCKGRLVVTWPRPIHATEASFAKDATLVALVAADHATQVPECTAVTAAAAAVSAAAAGAAPTSATTLTSEDSAAVTPEERWKKYLSGRDELDRKLALMHALYAEMNALMREKVLDARGDSITGSAALDPPKFDVPDGLRIDDDDTLGRCLVSTTTWAASDVMLKEKPCVILPAACVALHEKCDYLAAWRGFTAEQRVALRSFASHIEMATKEDWEMLGLSETEIADLKAENIDSSRDSLVHFRMVQRVNAHRFGEGAALFAVGSKCSHSCCPNTRSVQRDGHLELWATREILPDEPIYISYIQEDACLLEDTCARRQHLWDTFWFLCRCSRCSQPDTTRLFVCKDPCCGGAVSPLETAQVYATTNPEWLPEPAMWGCDRCCGPLPADDPWMRGRLEAERRVVERWRNLRTLVGDASARMASPEHFVTLWAAAYAGESDFPRAWEELQGLRAEASACLAPSHWVSAQAALLSTGLALGRAASGFQLPVDEGEVVQGVRTFVELALRVCPEVGWILQDTVEQTLSMLRDCRAGTLVERVALISGAAHALQEPELLDEMD